MREMNLSHMEGNNLTYNSLITVSFRRITSPPSPINPFYVAEPVTPISKTSTVQRIKVFHINNGLMLSRSANGVHGSEGGTVKDFVAPCDST